MHITCEMICGPEVMYVVYISEFKYTHNDQNFVPNGKYWIICILALWTIITSAVLTRWYKLCILLESSSRDISIDMYNSYQRMNSKACTGA
jgi:hypothetical protein